jgi:hypothetical protein
VRGLGSLASLHEGRRRTPDLRQTSVATLRRDQTARALAFAARDRRSIAPAALFHDAHAPPAAIAQIVAGLDA